MCYIMCVWFESVYALIHLPMGKEETEVSSCRACVCVKKRVLQRETQRDRWRYVACISVDEWVRQSVVQEREI